MGVLISRYLDGELSAAQRETVRDHLRLCDSCRDFYEVCARNDEIIAGAIRAHFGEKVTAAVMDRVKHEPPPVAPPRSSWTLRPGQWLAAAGILASIFTGWAVIQNLRTSGLRQDIAWLRQADRDLREQARSTERRRQAEMKLLMDDLAEARGQIYQGAIDEFARTVPEVSAAYLGNGVTVKACFPQIADCAYFDIVRRAEGEEQYSRPLNSVRLRQPEFTDLTARPGVTYEYLFIGASADGRHESLPVRVTVPPDGPGATWEVACRDVTEDNGAAELVVIRDGLAENYRVKPGDALGAGDFATGLSVERIEEGDETLSAVLAWPVADEAGRRVYERTGKPKVKLEQALLSVRQNKKVILRAADGKDFAVWRQGRAAIPAGR
jgi:hypothetical protein